MRMRIRWEGIETLHYLSHLTELLHMSILSVYIRLRPSRYETIYEDLFKRTQEQGAQRNFLNQFINDSVYVNTNKLNVNIKNEI